MRGFAFSIDMALGALTVVLFLALLSQTIHPTPIDTQPVLQLKAKDAALEWFYSSPTSTGPFTPPSSNKPFACSTAFRPDVSLNPLLPSNGDHWEFQTECVEAP